MASIVYSDASTELTQVRGQGHNPLSPVDDGARVRIKRFSYTATGAVTAGAVLEAVELPSKAVVVETVLSSLSVSNSAEVEIGYATKSAPTDDNSDALLAATATAGLSAAGERAVEVGEGIQTVTITTSVGDLATDDTLTGYILYVVNT